MPSVTTGLILGGAASFVASALAVLAAMLSSRISRSEEEPELVEITCDPERSLGTGPETLSLDN